MSIRVLLSALSLIGIIMPGYSQEQTAQARYHPFSGMLAAGIEAGMSWGKTDYPNIQVDLVGRVAVDYYLPTTSAGALGFRAFITAGYVSGGRPSPPNATEFRTPFNTLGGGLSYTFSIEETIFPYIFGGVSSMWFNPKDGDGNELPGSALGSYPKNEMNYHLELGAHLALTPEITLDASAGWQISPKDNWDDSVLGENNDRMVLSMLGFSYVIFVRADEDKDGVEDDFDKCPQTPKGLVVDEFGCPMDSDDDGVPDHLDKCQDTKPGTKVDKNGCPVEPNND